MHLWLVRHGHCGDSSPDSDLTVLGERQAQQTATHLANVGVTAIVSSPLLRALGTAGIIADSLDLPIEVWPDVREGFSWLHRAASRDELLLRFPRALLPPGFAVGGWDHGNDTYESVFLRCQQTLLQLKERFGENDQIVVVTHGGFANYLLHCILQIAPTTPQWFEMDYCAISRVYFVPEHEREHWPLYPAVAAKILCVNDCSHLTS
ncbi:MAG TPA: histidine phosphatase family protein [Ktedonobacteraceae bacterium]|nr:histidine phosphatase family protein [Ktedonobacteraceae bacterium]